MDLVTNDNATALPNEKELVQRINQLARRNDRKPVVTIGVKNLDGDMRLRIACHTESESAGVTQLLEDREFEDLSLSEEFDEEGDKESRPFDHMPPPGVDVVYEPIKV